MRQFLKRVKAAGVKRSGPVTTVAMGRSRVFDAYDVGDDTYILEQGVEKFLGERPSVLLTEKRSLGRRVPGRVMTVSTGNHSVAAFPLLDGRFWKLSRLKSSGRGETLLREIICANAVGGKLELSQREVPTRRIVDADRWLLGSCGFSMDEVVLGERNDVTLEHYRRLGQEWRVKPLA